jgi:hypothetical protein
MSVEEGDVGRTLKKESLFSTTRVTCVMPTNKLIDPKTDLIISRVYSLKFPENVRVLCHRQWSIQGPLE